MRVRFFSKGGPEVPSSRYRCYYFAEALSVEGLQVSICEPPPRRFGWRPVPGGGREMARLFRELRKTGPDDLLYFQRPIHNTPFTYLAAAYKLLRRRRMIFDFCDPLFVHAPTKTRLMTRLADAVVVSCEDLAVWARRYNSNVHVVPNSVPAEEIRPRPDTDADRTPVVGWTGAARLHQANLRLLLPALSRVDRRFTFRLIGARGADELVTEMRRLPGLDLEIVDWLEPSRMATATADLDIAVLPLEQSIWNAKLVTKLIEYLAAGVPVIASPVGDNRFAIIDGENGYLASSAEEWATKLRRLLDDPQHRRQLGEAGQLTARQRYCLDKTGPALARIATRTAGWRQPRG